MLIREIKFVPEWTQTVKSKHFVRASMLDTAICKNLTFCHTFTSTIISCYRYTCLGFCSDTMHLAVQPFARWRHSSITKRTPSKWQSSYIPALMLPSVECILSRRKFAFNKTNFSACFVTEWSLVTATGTVDEWLCAMDESDRRLATAAIVTEEMRAAILRECGFHCSAGIAHNKVTFSHAPFILLSRIYFKDTLGQLFSRIKPLKRLKICDHRL